MKTDRDHVFPGDSEMARSMRELDWPAVGMGDPADWPVQLREACRIMLTSRHPAVLWWGPQLRCLYNDAFLELLGDRRPALAAPGAQVRSDVWHILGPRLQEVLEGAEPTWLDRMMLPLNRHGYREETYWTYAFSPLFDDGAVGGVLTACHDITEQVVGERRMAVLQRLGAQVGTARSVREACELVAEALREEQRDIPFAAVYARDPDGDGPELVATSPPGADPRPRDGGPGGWPVEEVARTGRPVVVADVAERFGELPSGGWPVPPREAMVLPLPGEHAFGPVGVIVLAASAGRALDGKYRAFLDLVARQAAGLVNGGLAYQVQRRRAEELAELDRAKTVFLSDISHEFRTPLTLIMGPVEELRARLQDAEPWVRKDLEVIHRNGLRLSKLVDTLLDYARIEAGRMEARYQPTDLAVFTADLAGMLRTAIERAGLRLEVDCPPLPEPVYVDRSMWEKVVLSLLSNALKFTFEGSIAVRLRAEDGQAVLQVSDTGVGVSQKDLPRLFERFQRIEAPRTRSIEGDGVALALVRELVRLHGGTITADSTPGKGTTFTVRLPFGHAHLPQASLAPESEYRGVSGLAEPYVAEALHWVSGDVPEDIEPQAPLGRAEPTAPFRPSSVGRPSGPPARVLIAEDNPDLRGYLWRLLRPGYAVQTVGDGQEALEVARADPPDLIVSGVLLPRLNGFQLVSALRADPRTAGVPVLLLSALAGEFSIEGLAAGADDYLVKPFSAAELLARVRANVELARLRNHHARWRAALIDSLQEAFFVMDEDGAVTEINSAFTDILGYGPEGLPYRPVQPWWADAVTAGPREGIESVRASSGSRIIPVTHRDGHRLWVAITLNEVEDPDTGRRMKVGTMRDVTAEWFSNRRDAALANLGLRMSDAKSLPENLRIALGELARLWQTRRALAVTWDPAGRPQVLCSIPDDLPEPPGEVLATVEGLRNRPVLRPITFARPAGVGITLEYPGGPLAIWLEPDPVLPFTSQDRSLLVALCGYIGQSLQRISLVGQQREMILAFQRAILGPGALPAEFSVRYEPAVRPLQVGGDWYDVVDLSNGRIGIVVGDCVGHGVSAAAVMGQMRSACRALLLQLANPARTLTAMDGFAGRIPGAMGTTMFCGVLDTRTGRLVYSNAGHPPGIFVHPDGRTELLEGGGDLPLGVLPELPRSTTTCALCPGGTVLLYTDGLIERRHRSLDAGIRQIAAVVREGRTAPPEELAQRLMAVMRPDGGFEDDVALLLYRRPAAR